MVTCRQQRFLCQARLYEQSFVKRGGVVLRAVVCGVVLVVSCIVLFLLCVYVCDLGLTPMKSLPIDTICSNTITNHNMSLPRAGDPSGRLWQFAPRSGLDLPRQRSTTHL